MRAVLHDTADKGVVTMITTERRRQRMLLGAVIALRLR